jgi:hypothetical protein
LNASITALPSLVKLTMGLAQFDFIRGRTSGAVCSEPHPVCRTCPGRFWKTRELGNVLNLTEADRVRLKINTIGTVDMTPEERKRKRKRKLRDRQWQRAKRLAQGATRGYQAHVAASSDRRGRAAKTDGQ